MTGHIRKRILRNGNSWQIIWDKGEDPKTGKRIRETQTIQGTKKQAEAIMNEKIAEYNKGAYVEPSKVTVNQLLDDWMSVYVEPTLAPNTIRGYKVNFDKHTVPYIGSIELQKLTQRQIQDMYKTLAEKGLSPRSIQYVHATLKKALDYAYKQQFVRANVACFLSPPKQTKPKIDVYNETEAQQLLQKVFDTPMEIPVNIALGLGMRRGEILALKWSDFDFEKGTVFVSRNLVHIGKKLIFDKPKTAAGIRLLSLPGELIPLLQVHKARQSEHRLLLGKAYQNDDLVCCKVDGAPLNPGSFSHSFSDFLKKNYLRHIRFHDLRHTNATLMLLYGVPTKIASARLGHANIQITLDTYTHVLPEMQQDAADKLNNGIFKNLNKDVV